MRLIIMGPPGSGKGTVAQRMATDFKLKHIAPGDLFREEVAKKTKLGLQAKDYMDKGILVPDKLTIAMVKKRLDGDFILDGFPRTLEQAKALESYKIEAVVYLDIAEEKVVERLSNRRTCEKCGLVYNLKTKQPKHPGACDKCNGTLVLREDDKPETIRKRFQVYEQETAPLLKYYEKEKNLLKRIDGSGAPDKVYYTVLEAIRYLLPE